MKFEDEFISEIRLAIEVSPGDYYWREYESGMDHQEIESPFELAKDFFNLGVGAAKQGLENRCDKLASSLATVFEMVEKIQESYDSDYEPHQEPQNLRDLRMIGAHIMGTWIELDGTLGAHSQPVTPKEKSDEAAKQIERTTEFNKQLKKNGIRSW